MQMRSLYGDPTGARALEQVLSKTVEHKPVGTPVHVANQVYEKLIVATTECSMIVSRAYWATV